MADNLILAPLVFKNYYYFEENYNFVIPVNQIYLENIC